MIAKWYITVAAVHDWQRILGLPAVADGGGFDGPAKSLDEICRAGPRLKTDGPTQIWQTKTDVRGRRVRLELYVRPAPRDEGTAPQLVRVRLKGGTRGGAEARAKRKDSRR